MKVLVATRLGQGRKAYDLCTTLEGELIVIPPSQHVCFHHARVVHGVASGGESTTFMVVDRPDLGRDWYRDAIADGLARGGWTLGEYADDPTLDELVDAMLDVAMTLAPGTVCERVGWEVRIRIFPDWSTGNAA
jgi:hypothetical protein